MKYILLREASLDSRLGLRASLPSQLIVLCVTDVIFSYLFLALLL